MVELTLFPIKIMHAPAIAKLFNDPLIVGSMPESVPMPYELAHAVSFCESAMINEENGIGIYRAIFMQRAFVGYIGLTFFLQARCNTAELGYCLGSEYRGRGIMSIAIGMLTDYVFIEHSHIHRIQCSIPAINKSSSRAVEKAGYIHEATLKDGIVIQNHTTDELIYSCLRRHWAR